MKNDNAAEIRSLEEERQLKSARSDQIIKELHIIFDNEKLMKTVAKIKEVDFYEPVRR